MCDELKEAHFDVVSYYCRQYGMQTVRISADQFHEAFAQKVQDLNLKLSIGDLNSWDQLENLKDFDQTILNVHLGIKTFDPNGVIILIIISKYLKDEGLLPSFFAIIMSKGAG